jgi:hypothetical protein
MAKHGNAEKWAARSERLAAALRENLKRRKEQARGRAGAGQLGEDLAAIDAGIGAGIEAAGPDFRRNPGSKSAGGAGGSKTGRGG